MPAGLYRTQRDQIAMSNIIRLAEEPGELIDRTDVKQVGRPAIFPKEHRRISGALGTHSRDRVKLAEQLFDHSADIGERLEPSPGQDTIGRSFFSPSLLPLEWRETRRPGSGSAVPALPPNQ